MVAGDLGLSLDVPHGSLTLGVGEAVFPTRGVFCTVDHDFVGAVRHADLPVDGAEAPVDIVLVGAADARAVAINVVHAVDWGAE